MTGGPGTAVERCERVIASRAAAVRLAAIPLLAWVAAGPERAWTLAAIPLGAVESAVFAIACRRAGALRGRWVVGDVLYVAVLLALTGLPVATGGTARQSPCYLFAAT